MADGETPRVLEAKRGQLRWQAVDLEASVRRTHRLRVIWAMIERLDLSAFYATIAARGATAGRPAIDPKILLAVWLYAISEGVGSARHVARLCTRDDGERGICRGGDPKHPRPTDLRGRHGPE